MSQQNHELMDLSTGPSSRAAQHRKVVEGIVTVLTTILSLILATSLASLDKAGTAFAAFEEKIAPSRIATDPAPAYIDDRRTARDHLVINLDKSAPAARKGSLDLRVDQVAVPGAESGEPPALTTVIVRPARAAERLPVVVALHGCGGLWGSGGALDRRQDDWARRFAAHGWATVMPDSFGSRGVGPQCGTGARVARAWRERVGDVRAVHDWLLAQPWVDRDRIALLGWSNGGSTTLAALEPRARPAHGDFAAAVAFYPGCRAYAKPTWSTRRDLLLLIGEADDWTPAAPCRALAAAHPDRVVLYTYPGAYHDFDQPDMAVHQRRGLAFTADGGGSAHLGTDPAARADAIERVPAWIAAKFAAVRPASEPKP